MKIHHIRNATLVIEIENQKILIDPMLGGTGTQPPYALFRHKPAKNPTVPMPHNSDEMLTGVTQCVVTHRHPDHINKAGIKFLREKKIPVICSSNDSTFYKKKGLEVTHSVNFWEAQPFIGGTVLGVPARHGYGYIAKIMGHVMGFFIQPEGHPSVYLTSDTIYTKSVERVLKEMQPDISVLACGRAQFDIGPPLLMHMEDIVRFVKDAPGKVMCNHLEAINHCPTTRKDLRKRLMQEGLLEKIVIPEDGETFEL